MDRMATGSVISPPTRMVRRQPKKREPSSAAATGTSPSATGTPQRLVDTTSAGQAPAMAPSLADAKRLKHREYVKRSYNKKITTIEALKAELAALEAQYATMLTMTSTQTPAASNAANDDESLLVQYTQLTAMKNRLREENDALYQLNASRMMAADRIHQLLRTETPLPRVATPFRFRSLPAAEYSQLIVEARDDVLRFIHAPDKLSTGASVFGWTDQRQVVGDALKFALEKRFVGVSAAELLERSWRIFASPTVFPQIYTASLNVRFVELERVSDDTVLFYRTINADGSNVCVKVLFVLSRLKLDEGGYMLVFRSLDRTRLRFHEDEIYEVVAETRALGQTRQDLWVDKYIWVIFRDSDEKEGGCDFHFGGATTTSIWLQEVLFIALRWESLAVGPQFSLTMD